MPCDYVDKPVALRTTALAPEDEAVDVRLQPVLDVRQRIQVEG